MTDEIMTDELDWRVNLPIDDKSTLMTIEDFVESVEKGWLVDYDGYGYWATSTYTVSDQHVKPSMFMLEKPELKRAGLSLALKPFKRATHIAWYNR